MFAPTLVAQSAKRLVATDTGGVIAAHRAWWLGFAGADTAHLQATTAAAALLTLSSGRTYDRPALLAQSATYTKGANVKFDWTEESVRPLGPGIVLVASRVTETEGPTSSVFRYMTVMQRRGTTWQVSAAQSTRVLDFTPRVPVSIAGALPEFAGSYRTPRGAALRVVQRDSALVIIDPSGSEAPIEPVGPGLFEFTVLSPSNGLVRFAFVRDASGRVTALARLLQGSVNVFPRMP